MIFDCKVCCISQGKRFITMGKENFYFNSASESEISSGKSVASFSPLSKLGVLFASRISIRGKKESSKEEILRDNTHDIVSTNVNTSFR